MSIANYILARQPFTWIKGQYTQAVLEKNFNNLNNALQQTQFSTVTANYTLTARDLVVFCNAVAGSFSITIPSADRMAGSPFTFRRVDTSGNTVTLVATIDGVVNPALATMMTIMSDGTSWWSL